MQLRAVLWFSFQSPQHLYIASSISAGHRRTLNFKQCKEKEKKIHITSKTCFSARGHLKLNIHSVHFHFSPNVCLGWHMNNQRVINQTKTFLRIIFGEHLPQKAINFYSQSFVYKMICLWKELRHTLEIFNWHINLQCFSAY